MTQDCIIQLWLHSPNNDLLKFNCLFQQIGERYMPKPDHPITPAIRVLREKKIAFEPRLYEYKEHGGTRVSAEALGVDQHCVVKTIVLETDTRAPLIVGDALARGYSGFLRSAYCVRGSPGVRLVGCAGLVGWCCRGRACGASGVRACSRARLSASAR